MKIPTSPDLASEASLLLAQDLYGVFTPDVTQPTPYRRSRHRPLQRLQGSRDIHAGDEWGDGGGSHENELKGGVIL